MKLAKRVTLCRKVPVRFCVSSNFFRWVRAEVSTANGLCRVPGCPRGLWGGVGIEPVGLQPDWPPGTSTGGWQWLLGSSGAEARGAGGGLALARASPWQQLTWSWGGWSQRQRWVGPLGLAPSSRGMEQELEPVKGEGRAPGTFQLLCAKTMQQINSCMCHLRVETQFPAALHSPGPEPCWFSRPVKGIQLHRAGGHGPGAQMPHFSRGSLSLWFPFLLWVTCWSCGFWLDCFSFPPTYFAVFFLYTLSCIRAILLISTLF